MKKNVKTIKDLVKNLRSKNAELEGLTDQKDCEIAQLKDELAESQRCIETLRDQVQLSETSFAAIKEQYNFIVEASKEAQEQVKQLKAELEDTKQQHTHEVQYLRMTCPDCYTLREDLNDLKFELEILEEQKQAFAELAAEKEKECSRWSQTVDRLRAKDDKRRALKKRCHYLEECVALLEVKLSRPSSAAFSV